MSAALALDFAGGLDRSEFARQCAIEPDAKQCAILRSTGRNVAVCTSRQWGKSTTAALLGASDAWYNHVSPEARRVLGARARALVLITSPTQRQSDLTFAKLQYYLGERIAQAHTADVARESENKVFTRAPGAGRRVVLSSELVDEWKVRSLLLRSGAMVVSLPGVPETLRGFDAVTRVIVDEAAFTGDGLIGALRPMLLVSRGSMTLLSTPNGKRGEFFRVFVEQRGKEGDTWERHEVPVECNGRIDPADVEVDRRELPTWLFEQEYKCRFTSLLGAVFHESDIEGALVDDEGVMDV